MGREIRRVPPDWKHPKDTGYRQKGFLPMHDSPFDPAMDKWIEARRKWNADEDPDRDKHPMAYHEWAGGPPNPEYYRPAWQEETRTAYQVYETVSEGTPVSPVFATKDELIQWLVNDGRGMGIGGKQQKLSREAAERFVEAAWAPSMVVDASGIHEGAAIYEKETP